MTEKRIQDAVVFQMGRLLGASIGNKPFDLNDFVDPVMKVVSDRIADLEEDNRDLRDRIGAME